MRIRQLFYLAAALLCVAAFAIAAPTFERVDQNDHGSYWDFGAIIFSQLTDPPDPPAGTGEIIQDAVSYSTSTSWGTTNTFSHTVADQTDRILVLTVAARGSAGVLTAAFNGDAMTALTQQTISTSHHQRMFYLIEPDVGAHNIVITSTLAQNICGIAVSLYGAAQEAPEANDLDAAATGTASPVLAVTSSTDGTVVLTGVFHGVTETVATAYGESIVYQKNLTSTGGQVGLSKETIATAGANSFGWTAATSGTWAETAIAIAPSGEYSPAAAVSVADVVLITDPGGTPSVVENPTQTWTDSTARYIGLETSREVITTASPEAATLAIDVDGRTEYAQYYALLTVSDVQYVVFRYAPLAIPGDRLSDLSFTSTAAFDCNDSIFVDSDANDLCDAATLPRSDIGGTGAVTVAVPKNLSTATAWWVASDWDTEKPDPVVEGDYFVLGAGALDATETISESGITLNVVGNTTSAVTISGDNNEIWYRQGSALTITDNGTGNVVVKNCPECE